MCEFSNVWVFNVWVCVCVGFVMCGDVCLSVCMFEICNVWVCVCVGFLMCGFFNVWVYVCVEMCV
jgi:hypothetical protein